MKYLFFLIINCFLSFQAFSYNCSIISGANKDHNGALKKLKKYQEKGKVYFEYPDTLLSECIIFDSWEEAIEDFKQKIASKWLFIQSAHGFQGGAADCNGGSTDPERILSFLQKAAEKTKIGVIFNSCYSGDLFKKFTLNAYDENSTYNKKNLCLLTSSLPGRYSNGSSIESLRNLMGNRLNLLSFYKVLMKGHRGLISAAGLEKIGLVNYYKHGRRYAENFVEKLSNYAFQKNPINFFTQLVSEPSIKFKHLKAYQEFQHYKNKNYTYDDLVKKIQNWYRFKKNTFEFNTIRSFFSTISLFDRANFTCDKFKKLMPKESLEVFNSHFYFKECLENNVEFEQVALKKRKLQELSESLREVFEIDENYDLRKMISCENDLNKKTQEDYVQIAEYFLGAVNVIEIERETRANDYNITSTFQEGILGVLNELETYGPKRFNQDDLDLFHACADFQL